MKTLFKRITRLTIYQHLLISLLIRIVLILISNVRLFGVSYTDIDYIIFSDAAKLLSNNKSPFDRPTYRYTPLIAYLMLPNIWLWYDFGKLLFSIFDIINGLLLYKMIKNYSNHKMSILSTTIVWLYNPLIAIISTRGSCESVLINLILLFLWFLNKNNYILSGMIYGLSIHFKIYPIIYSLMIYLIMGKSNDIWHVIEPNKKRIKFFLSTLLSFCLLTYLSYVKFGLIYIEEAWLYHFKRKDTQHNFSPYFYFYYIFNDEQMKKLLSLIAFIPQLLFIISSSFYYGLSKNKKHNLFICLFLQTMAFVTFNKVITSQYFVWYIGLLPLVIPNLNIKKSQWILIFIIWIISQIQWLLPAYLYEIKGMNNCLHWLGISSCVFVILNFIIIVKLINSYNLTKFKKDK